MDLYLCEKPSQANDLAAVLGASQKGKGYLYNGSGTTVSWAYGHMLELFMPDQYDERYKRWSLDTLPIVPDSWKSQVRQQVYTQFKVLEGLIGKASTIYIATDFDREGEAIARSLLERLRYNGPIRRVCLTALDPASIKKALGNIRDGNETLPMYFAAQARQRADWLIGMNASRLFTALCRDVGYGETLHIGRVITPTIALVCQRDTEIADFTPAPYWTLTATVSVQNGHFQASWVPPKSCSDDQGRCINKAFAEQVAAQVPGQAAIIEKAEKKPGRESPPLPFDLTSLQQYASKRWGYTAQQVLDGSQSLYETHKAITYPRTDSRYLPASQKSDISTILQALILSDQGVSGLVAGADPSRSTRVFNDKEVTAHHAIIPTPAQTDIRKMSELELNLYDAIRRFYIAQFYSDFQFTKTDIEVLCGKHLFRANGKAPLKPGWKVLFGSDQESAPTDEDEDRDEPKEQGKLPKVNQGEPATMQECDVTDKMTRPSPHFTDSTLLAAMVNISRFVDEERFKQILKDTAGLGTPATRAGIIEGAVSKGYLKRQKKVLIATDKAHSLMSILPAAIKSPGMTAGWEQELEKIASGETSMKVFMQNISRWITNLVDQLKAHSDQLTHDNGQIARTFGTLRPDTHQCFVCGGGMKRIKGTDGFFWGCQTAACRKTFPDNRGKPIDPSKSELPPKHAPKCPECGGPMLKRKSSTRKKNSTAPFWGCARFPECRGTKPVKRRKD